VMHMLPVLRWCNKAADVPAICITCLFQTGPWTETHPFGKGQVKWTGKEEGQSAKGKAKGESNLERQVLMEGQVQRVKKEPQQCRWQMQHTYGGRLVCTTLSL